MIEPNLQAGVSDLPPKNPYPVLSIDRSGQVIYANGAARSMIKDWKNLDGQPVLEFCRQLVEETLSSGMSTRIVEIEHEDRTFSLTVILNEDQSGADLFGIDITERKAAEEEVRFAADHDLLTRLPNPHLLADLLEKQLAKAKKNGQISAFLYLDINNF
ncbi:MAG: diguanylate cyclase, partial [Actinomycetia bacterium]|nr:diguanylate cyclase [Actinomycetes bacterium]